MPADERATLTRRKLAERMLRDMGVTVFSSYVDVAERYLRKADRRAREDVAQAIKNHWGKIIGISSADTEWLIGNIRASITTDEGETR